VIHGERDGIVPPVHGDELFAAAPEPKRLHRVAGAGHNDLLTLSGEAWARTIAAWAAGVLPAR
jgi:fermentation-respiration switch protein FrsA (DUF1100 family)